MSIGTNTNSKIRIDRTDQSNSSCNIFRISNFHSASFTRNGFYFYPQRFDRTFLSMLDRFHETYPQVGLHMMLHFEHPDEFLAKDAEGNYIEDAQGFKQWIPATGEAIKIPAKTVVKARIAKQLKDTVLPKK